MDTHSLIKQLTEQLSNSPLEEEQITELKPIDFIFNFENSQDEAEDNKWSFLCVPLLERNKQTKRLEFDDIKYYKITDEELFKVYSDYERKDVNLFIEYLIGTIPSLFP